MKLGGFDIILGMDWLSKNQAEIICGEKACKSQNVRGIANFNLRRQQEF